MIYLRVTAFRICVCLHACQIYVYSVVILVACRSSSACVPDLRVLAFLLAHVHLHMILAFSKYLEEESTRLICVLACLRLQIPSCRVLHQKQQGFKSILEEHMLFFVVYSKFLLRVCVHFSGNNMAYESHQSCTSVCLFRIAL